MIIRRSAQPHIRNITTHFNVAEYFCPCGQCEEQQIDLNFAHHMEKLRSLRGRPMGFTPQGGAYRCRKYNSKIQGSPTSRHLYGIGGDVWAKDSQYIPANGIDIARAAVEVGFRRIGVGEHWCHLDMDTPTSDLAVWTYNGIDIKKTRKILEDQLAQVVSETIAGLV